jgi:hypothetical protein
MNHEKSYRRVWLLLTNGDERTYSGNLGYKDTSSVYLYDSHVSNHKQLHSGDVGFLADKEGLEGIGVIKDIRIKPAHKVLQRCPSCKRTTIGERRKRVPRFRCKGCKSEFDEPISDNVNIIEYEADFGSSFLRTEVAISSAQLRQTCLRLADQQSMREMDPARARDLIVSQESLLNLYDSAYSSTEYWPIDSSESASAVTHARELAQTGLNYLKMAIVELLEGAPADGLSNVQIGRTLGIYQGHVGHEGHVPRTVLAILESEGTVAQMSETKKWQLTRARNPRKQRSS